MVPILSVVTPPAPILTLDEAKAHLRVDFADDDSLITALIEAVTQTVDGATGWLGRALGPQTLVVTAGRFPAWCGDWRDWHVGETYRHHEREIRLRCPPIVSVSGIAYRNAAGATVTLDPASYVLSGRVLHPAFGEDWPEDACGPVSITYVAGYPGGVPEAIKAALKLMLGSLYANRMDDPALAAPASRALLGPWQVWD